MRIINLQGDRGIVAAVEIPPFPDHAMPKVVLWGSRAFTDSGRCDVLGRRCYAEVFAVVSLTPSPGLAHDTKPSAGEPVSDAPPVDRSAVTTLHGTPIGEHTELVPSGMQKDYVVLSDAERAKGFVQPVRRSYVHEKCGVVTTMGQALAETYARDPSFYSGTFCAGCKTHFPVGADGEFTWDGTDQKVGT